MYIVANPPHSQGNIGGEEKARLGEENSKLPKKKLRGKERKEGKKKEEGSMFSFYKQIILIIMRFEMNILFFNLY